MLLSDDPCNMFLVGGFSLALASFLLNTAPLDLFLDPKFGRFEPLCFDQLSIADLLVLLGLLLDDGELVLLQHFHSGLIERLLNQHVEHWLHLFIEVE